MVKIEIEIDEDRINRLGVIVGVFAAVGLGVGATVFIAVVGYADDFLSGLLEGIVALLALLLVFFLGPTVGGAASVVATRGEQSPAAATATGAVGSSRVAHDT